MRFHNAYMLGLLRRSFKVGKETRIIQKPADPAERKLNQRTKNSEAPKRFQTVHETQPRNTADSRWCEEMKKKYGNNIKDWPDKIPTIDEETLTQTTFKLPTKFNLKVKK